MTTKTLSSMTMALAAALFAPAAHSQSAVTVFGVADGSIRHVRNEAAGSVSSLASGGNSTSRIGLRGQEDLGQGLAAAFHLESGLRLDTGAPAGGATQFWDRRATLSLQDKRWGEIRLGRDQVPTHTVWLRVDPFAFVGVASSGNLQSGSAVNPGPIRAAFGATPSGLTPLSRTNNLVQLILPGGLAGVEGGIMFSAGEGGTAANGQHKVVAAHLGYANGPLALWAASTVTENDLTTTGRFKDQLLAGKYNFGPVSMAVGLRRFAYASSRQTNALLAAVVPVGAGQIKVSLLRADMAGRVGTTDVSGNEATQLGLGYVHSLSRRTVLYATYARINNGNVSTFVVPDGPTALRGRDSSGFEAGIRHTF